MKQYTWPGHSIYSQRMAGTEKRMASAHRAEDRWGDLALRLLNTLLLIWPRACVALLSFLIRHVWPLSHIVWPHCHKLSHIVTHCHTLSHIVWPPCCWWLSRGRGMSLVHDTQRCSVQKQIHKAVTNKHTLVSYRTSLNSVWTVSKTIWGQWLLREHLVCAPGNWILGPVRKQTHPVSQNRCPSNILFLLETF